MTEHSVKFIPLWCLQCKKILEIFGNKLKCANCNSSYKSIEGIPSFGGVNHFYEGKFAETEPDLTEGMGGAARTAYHLYQLFSQSHIRNRFIGRMMGGAKSTSKILDLGCGGGSRFLAKRGFVCGVDISLSSLTNARRIYPQVVHCDVRSVPFPDSSFDFIVSRDLIGHIPLEWKIDVHREMYRLCRHGGKIIHAIEVDSNNLVRRLAKKYSDLYKAYFQDQDGHVGLETPRDAIYRFELERFREIKVKPVFRTGIVRAGHYISVFDNEYREKSKAIDTTVRLAKAVNGNTVLRGSWAFFAGILDASVGWMLPWEYAQLLLVCYEKA